MKRADTLLKLGYENSKELLNMLRFLRHRTAREAGFQAFKELNTLEDYIHFAQNWFPALPLPDALLMDFLSFVQPYQPQYVAELSIRHSAMTFLLAQALPFVAQIIAIHRYYDNRMQLRYFAKRKPKMNLLTPPVTSSKLEQLLEKQRLDLLVIESTGEALKNTFFTYQNLIQESALIVCYPVQDTEFFQQLKSCYPYDELGAEQQRLGVIHYSAQVQCP